MICADESPAYDTLHAKLDTHRFNHAKEYRSDDGITNNPAESYFSRFPRMQYGQMHKFGNLYLDTTPMKLLTVKIQALCLTVKSLRIS